MASRLILPYSSVFDNNGHPLDGAKLHFFENGTGTPQDTYSDLGATIPNTNPVIADSQGQFGDIYLVGTYRVRLDDKNDVTQPDYPADDVIEIGVVTGTQKLSKGADVVSEAALFTTAGFPTDGNYFDITGTDAITSILTSSNVGTIIKLHFDGSLVLTHNATNLILPGGANIITSAGDEAEYVEYSSGAVRFINYQYAIRPSFRVTRGTAQQNNITGVDKILFNTVDWDTNGDFDIVTNNRLIPKVAGKYLLTSTIFFGNTVSTDEIIIYLYKNGSSIAQKRRIVSATSGSVTVTDDVTANGTDYFEIFAEDDGRDTADVNGAVDRTWFSGHFVSSH